MAKKRLTIDKYNRTEADIIAGQEDYKGRVSLTKPNQTKSIRQLLERSINGIDFTDTKTPFYEDEAQLTAIAFNKIQHMDFGERARFYEQVSEDTKKLSQQIDAHTQKLQEEQAKAREKEQKRLAYIDEQLGSIADDTNVE